MAGKYAKIPHKQQLGVLREDVGYSRHPGLTDSILGEISGIAAGVRLAAERWTDRSDSLAKLPRF